MQRGKNHGHKYRTKKKILIYLSNNLIICHLLLAKKFQKRTEKWLLFISIKCIGVEKD